MAEQKDILKGKPLVPVEADPNPSLANTMAEHAPLAKGSTTDYEDLGSAPTLASGSDVATPAPAPDADAAKEYLDILRPGSRIGRLEIGKTLGQGAFGVVVAAYDPKLKRKLAIKVLRPEVLDSIDGDAQTRLLREARAMARISHPNVVTVHDIGTVEGQVYIAMEFVAGCHLRDWLLTGDRSWKEVLATFSQAGQGLAAAHAKGLVHRDFKPDNVLVSEQGDVRVADFGLVSISTRKEKIESEQFAIPLANSDELSITRIGAVMGTALYMAPEQHRGDDAGPQADQFAFCASLYWALYHRQPFKGRNYEELRSNVLAGNLIPPPAKHRVPKWIWPILVKGLSTEPASRHKSMEVLLEQLARDPTAERRSRLKMVAIALAGLGAIGIYAVQKPQAGAVCQDAARHLKGTWDNSAQTRLAGVYSEARRGDGFVRLQSAVDNYTDEWVSMRTTVCRATRVSGEQSDSLLDLRMMCLDQRLGYLGEVLVRLQASADGAMLDRGVMAALGLPSVGTCNQSRSALAQMPLPKGDVERQAIARLSSAVDKAQALFDLGEPRVAGALLREALENATSYAPVMAQATYLFGKILSDLGALDEAEKTLRQSIEYGAREGDDAQVASSWLALAHLVGVEQEQYEMAYEMVRAAQLSLVRGKAGAFALAGADKAKAMILMREGKSKEARTLLEPALPIYEEYGSNTDFAFLLAALADAKAGDGTYAEAVGDYKLALAHLEAELGADHLENVYLLNNLAVALKNVGEVGAAREALRRSLVILQQAYGERHYSVVTILNNLGNLARREGDVEEAKRNFSEAISIGNEALEAGHPTVTKAIMNLGIVHIAEKNYEGATGRFLVALERSRASFSDDHPDVAMALNNVGESLSLENKYEEGLDYVREAMEMKVRIYGADHPKTASSIATVGTIQGKLGEVQEAKKHLQNALNIYVEVAGETHPRTIQVRSALGHLLESSGAASKAIPHLEQALAARGGPSMEQAQDHLALAKALWKTSKRSAASKEVEVLNAMLEGLEDGEEVASSLKTWLQRR